LVYRCLLIRVSAVYAGSALLALFQLLTERAINNLRVLNTADSSGAHRRHHWYCNHPGLHPLSSSLKGCLASRFPPHCQQVQASHLQQKKVPDTLSLHFSSNS
jgi:hypothetical protein